LPLVVETISFRTGSTTTPYYVWNNVSQGGRQYNITDYGKYSVTIRMGSGAGICQSPPSDTLYVKRLANVAISDRIHIYDGTPKNVTVTTDPSSLVVRVTYNGAVEPPVELGTYRVVAEIDDAGYKGKQVSTMIISTSLTPTNTADLAETQLKIYPNPVDDFLYIDGLESIFGKQQGTIELINATGAICIRKHTNEAHVSLDLSHIPQGIYLLRLTTSKQTIVRKVIRY